MGVMAAWRHGCMVGVAEGKLKQTPNSFGDTEPKLTIGHIVSWGECSCILMSVVLYVPSTQYIPPRTLMVRAVHSAEMR
jgi:hypothetical protein